MTRKRQVSKRQRAAGRSNSSSIDGRLCGGCSGDVARYWAKYTQGGRTTWFCDQCWKPALRGQSKLLARIIAAEGL